jgi:type VI secretion system protein ImpC
MAPPQPIAAAEGAPGSAGRPLLRLLVVADLAPGRQAGPLPIAPGDGVDAALAGLSPSLALRVPNRLGSDPKELAVELRIARLDDFHPDALARAVPALADLVAARALLDACRRGELDAADLAPRLPEPLRAPAAAAPGASASPLDGLLRQVDLPATDAPLAGRPLAELLRPLGRDAAAQGLAELDRRLTRQVAEIAGAERLRELEAAWRGVRFLAARAAPAAPAGHAVRLEILPAGREELLDAFFAEVFQPEHAGDSATPLSAVVLGHELDRGPADAEVMRHLARMGESLRVPFLGAVGPAFWGIRQPKLLASLPDLVRKVAGGEYAKWNGLRREEAAAWLCLAAGRLALRDGWGSEAPRPAAFEWREAGDADRPLWASGAYALGAALAQAFAAGGVRFPATGAEPPALLADLPASSPVEVALPDAKVRELVEVGLAPLVARPGERAAWFPAIPMVQAPKRFAQAEATAAAAAMATLPHQAFAGAAAHALQTIGRSAAGGLAAEEVRRHFEAGLLSLLTTAGEAPAPEEAQVEVQASAESPDLWEVAVRLRPGFQISGSGVDLVLGSAVPR